MDLYTLGHSAHPIERFLGLLAAYEIRMLADVRTVPASRFHPQYGKRALEMALTGAGIAYVYLGEGLGGRPADASLYPPEVDHPVKDRPHPMPDFSLVMQREFFTRGIEELLALAGGQRTAILCSEEDPARCHRQLLIAVYLARHAPDVHVWHIRGSGALEDARLMGG
jgi:uncharacterized protein (DUF488 family)